MLVSEKSAAYKPSHVFNTFHQPLITLEALWPQPGVRSVQWGVCLNNSELKCCYRARVRAAVLVCGRAVSRKSTIPYVSIPYLLFWMVLCSWRFVVPRCMNSAMRTHLLSQETALSSFLPGRRRLFKPFSACLVNVLWLLVFSVHRRIPRFTSYYSCSASEQCISIFVALLKVVLCALCASMSIVTTHLVQNLW
jgi:hypothetical protein